MGPEQLAELEKRLWGAADELPANSKLKASEYSMPVLGLRGPDFGHIGPPFTRCWVWRLSRAVQQDGTSRFNSGFPAPERSSS